MPPTGGSDTVAVEVRGDSMSGVLDNGWIVYYDRRSDPPTPDMLGKLCVLGLEDGRTLVKRLVKAGANGSFDLYSVNAPPMLDRHVVWAAPVVWIKPA